MGDSSLTNSLIPASTSPYRKPLEAKNEKLYQIDSCREGFAHEKYLSDEVKF